MSALKDKILNYVDLPYEDVVVPQWGDMKIRIRTLTAKERGEFEIGGSVQNKKDFVPNRDLVANMRARLIAVSAVDPDSGEQIFAPEDAEALGKKSAAAMDLLFDKACALSGINKNAEKLEKN